MRFLFLYKGDYQTAVAGVAIRYLSLAKALIADGHTVSIAGRAVPASTIPDLRYHRVANPLALMREIWRADRIVLQGGGPLILLLLSLLGGEKRRVLFDVYAPHWLELYSAAVHARQVRWLRRFRLWGKIYFNYVRIVWARLFAHGIVVGTSRQLDLVRGIVSQVGDFRFDTGIHIITGGCDPLRDDAVRKQADALSVGWLGGLWDWFDVHPVLDAIGVVAGESDAITISFYGVDPEKVASLRNYIDQRGYPASAFRFEPWVPYEQRFDVWSVHDVGIVWANATLENDYATRTRNFDCISLGIPVIQNDDSFWAEIVTQHDAGTVLHAAGDLVAALRIYRDDRSLLARQSANIRRLQPHFSWSRIAADYNAAFSSTGGSQNKLFAGLYLLALLPATLVGFALFLRFRKQGGRMRPAG